MEKEQIAERRPFLQRAVQLRKILTSMQFQETTDQYRDRCEAQKEPDDPVKGER
jgi:hypothetical protein